MKILTSQFLPVLALLMFSPLRAFAEEGSGVDAFIGSINGVMASVLFFDLLGFTEAARLPFIVAWLVVAAVFFTIYMRFVNFRAFKHAIEVTAGKYDDPASEGEVTHFQALTTALSATVGLGNIAGVAIAVSVGGPGATFWMIVAGLLGMTSKFAECTAGQMFRTIRPDGHVMGGAMFYLRHAFTGKSPALVNLGKALAVLFAILCVGASFGGGNAFQINQAANGVQEALALAFGGSEGDYSDYRWIMGLTMAVLTFAVIVGGVRSIALAAEKIVPFMCGLYVAACLWILLSNLGHVPAAFGTIISGAFSPEAGYGGFIGVLVQGFQRAAFSNEAGVGSAPIAHAAAKTSYPVREGIVALLEPFIDTIIVCTMTALVIVITGAYDRANPEFAPLIEASKGATLTAKAMGAQISWFPYLLSLAVTLFAFSTMISWSYYGERCWSFLFGDSLSLIYKILFCIVTFIGAIASSTAILDFSDLMLLGMALPNIIGVAILAPKIRASFDSYWADLQSGKIRPYKG